MIKVALLWLINEKGELLLAQRSLIKPADPGVWGPSVTGKFDPGETPEQALAREVKEELDLDADAYNPLPLTEVEYVHPDGETRRFYQYYAVVDTSIDQTIHIDTVEVAGIKWMPLSDLRELMRIIPEMLVPSANPVWPEAFEALEAAGAL